MSDEKLLNALPSWKVTLPTSQQNEPQLVADAELNAFMEKHAGMLAAAKNSQPVKYQLVSISNLLMLACVHV